MTSPSELDWGAVTPEGYNREKNEALFVFNFYMVSDEAKTLAKEFVLGRILWYSIHLPPDCSFLIHVDLRDQAISIDKLNAWRDDITNKIAQNSNIKIEITFLLN